MCCVTIFKYFIIFHFLFSILIAVIGGNYIKTVVLESVSTTTNKHGMFVHINTAKIIGIHNSIKLYSISKCVLDYVLKYDHYFSDIYNVCYTHEMKQYY